MKNPSRKTPTRRRKLDFRKVEIQVAEALAIGDADLSPDGQEQVFRDIVQHSDCGMDWLLPALWKCEKEMEGDNPEAALTTALLVIVKLARQVKVLGMALPACRKRIGHSVRITEGGLSKARTTKGVKAMARKQTMIDAVKTRMAANPKESLHSARQYVATKHAKTFDAVRRATAAMKPRKKMKK